MNLYLYYQALRLRANASCFIFLEVLKMQTNPVQIAQYNVAASQNISKTTVAQNTTPVNTVKSVQSNTAQPSDTVSISAAAQKLARSEVNESSVAETIESAATQVMEGERAAASGTNRISVVI